MIVLDVLALLLCGAGAFFFLAGTVGLVRFPDALSRLHALSKADNLGLGLTVLGLMCQVGTVAAALELLLVWLLALVASATNAHLLARAALSDAEDR